MPEPKKGNKNVKKKWTGSEQRDPHSLQTGPINRAVADNARERAAAVLFNLRGQKEEKDEDQAAANLLVGGNANKKCSRTCSYSIETNGFISRTLWTYLKELSAQLAIYCAVQWISGLQMELRDACVDSFVVSLLFN